MIVNGLCKLTIEVFKLALIFKFYAAIMEIIMCNPAFPAPKCFHDQKVMT